MAKTPPSVPEATLHLQVMAGEHSFNGDGRESVVRELYTGWIAWVKEQLHIPSPAGPAVTLGLTFTGEGVRLMATLKATQKVTGTLNPLDIKGRPAKLDGVPVWESSNPDVATVEASIDGLTATVRAVDSGDAQIKVTADADLGEGVRTLTGLGDITVLPLEAVTLDISFGAPEEQ